TAHKALDQLRHERRQKRRAPGVETCSLEGMIGPEPSPEFAAQVRDECRRLLRLLGDPELEAVALWKMEGYPVAEMRRRLGDVNPTVERKVGVIRSLWAEEIS